MRVSLRLANESELSTMARIHTQSWRAAYAGMMPDYVLKGFGESQRVSLFKNAMMNKPVEFYLLYAGDVPAGMAALSFETDEVEIGSFYFLSEYWGKGAARAAMALLFDMLRRKGVRRAFAWVFEQNIRARRFYEKCGFTLTDKTKTLNIGVPISEVRYDIRL